MLLIYRIKIFENILILLTNAIRLNTVALSIKHKTVTKNEPCQNYLSHMSIPYSKHPKLSKNTVKYICGGGARGAYLAHGLLPTPFGQYSTDAKRERSADRSMLQRQRA